MKQHRMRQVSYDTEVGKVTADYRVFHVRRLILVVGVHDGLSVATCSCHEGSLLDIKDERKELDMIQQWRSVLRGSQTFKTVVEGSKHAGTQSESTAAEVERRHCAREHAAFENPGSRCRSHVGW